MQPTKKKKKLYVSSKILRYAYYTLVNNSHMKEEKKVRVEVKVKVKRKKYQHQQKRRKERGKKKE